MQIAIKDKTCVLHFEECINRSLIQSVDNITINNLPFWKGYVDKFTYIVIYSDGIRNYLKQGFPSVDIPFRIEEIIKANELNRIPPHFFDLLSLEKAPYMHKTHFKGFGEKEIKCGIPMERVRLYTAIHENTDCKICRQKLGLPQLPTVHEVSNVK